jgi:hypothetical protein
MRWITREKVKVDRVACPWPIKKFIDPQGCELGHHGEDVSFNSILKKYKLIDPALVLLGEIVRAADSHPGNPHPAGEGLRWIAHGFSALGLTDHEILEREFIVYDALFAECKRQVGQTPKL